MRVAASKITNRIPIARGSELIHWRWGVSTLVFCGSYLGIAMAAGSENHWPKGPGNETVTAQK